MRTIRGFCWSLSVLMILVVSTHARASDDEKTAKDTKSPEKLTNTQCPVMVGEDVSAKYFVEYSGQKIYLCCKKCVSRFQKDPEKYVKRLAEMNATAAKTTVGNHAETSSTGGSADDSAGKSTAKASRKHEEEEDEDDDDDDKGTSAKAQNRSDSGKDSSQKKSKKHDD